MFKIGYINDEYNNIDEYNDHICRAKYMYNCIINVAKKYGLNYDFKLVDDYINEECNLIIYDLFSVNIEKIYWHDYFKQAKGNPKWLFFDIGEPHHIGLTQWCEIDGEHGSQWKDDKILRTLCNFKHPYKGYSITTYENTPGNFQYIPFIKWGFLNQLKDLQNSGELHKQRSKKKKYFCSMVLSDTTPERYNFYNYMEDNYKSIRSFGKTRNNMGGVFFNDEILKDIIPYHKFNICFENTRSDFNEAYITEKIFRAYAWGTVPIYWGENNYIYDFLNKDSFINLTGLSLKESLELIKEYDNNDKLYYDMLYANPINESYDINKIYESYDLFIKKILTDVYE